MARSRELELLRRRLGEAAQGSGSIVLISGEAGIAKTRLWQEAGEPLSGPLAQPLLDRLGAATSHDAEQARPVEVHDPATYSVWSVGVAATKRVSSRPSASTPSKRSGSSTSGCRGRARRGGGGRHHLDQAGLENVIVTHFEARYRLVSDDELRIIGQYDISPTESTGTFADMEGHGSIQGVFTCLGDPVCAELREFTDFVGARGDLSKGPGEIQPGLVGTFNDPTVETS